MSNYYIYMFMNQENCPFYVGMGKDYRYCIGNHMSQSFLRDEINKVGKENIRTHFLHKNLTCKEARQWERYWISYLGKRCDSTGQLVNLSNGGNKGPTGYKHTEKAKKKISETHKGHTYNLGRKHPKNWAGHKRPQYTGSKNLASKMTEEGVIEMRKLYALGEYTTRQLVPMFGISQSAVCGIINRKTWRHI